MNSTKAALRNQVRHLAEEAFQHKLISGYGDGPNYKEFQIIFQGKPRHFSLEYAYFFLENLLFSSQVG